MALENTQSFVTVVGDGATKSVPVTFPLLDPSHIVLYGYKADSTAFTYATPADYTVVSNNNPQDNTPFYTVQLVQALPTNWKLTVARDVPLIQDVVFDQQGGVEPKIYEYQLDYLTMICQQLQRQIDLRLPFPDNVSPADVINIIYNSTATLNQIRAAVAAVETSLANKAALVHSHQISDVNQLQARLNEKANAAETATALALKADATTVAGKADKSALANYALKTEMNTALAAKADVIVVNAKADKSALDGKSDKGHTHVVDDVANMQSVVTATVRTEVENAMPGIFSDPFWSYDSTTKTLYLNAASTQTDGKYFVLQGTTLYLKGAV